MDVEIATDMISGPRRVQTVQIRPAWILAENARRRETGRVLIQQRDCATAHRCKWQNDKTVEESVTLQKQFGAEEELVGRKCCSGSSCRTRKELRCPL